ncbi:MAG: hypothetical protein EXR75_08390 [Myxococcales bacterium]|nr:hypothetical protein [Myxococcales bacterium]
MTFRYRVAGISLTSDVAFSSFARRDEDAPDEDGVVVSHVTACSSAEWTEFYTTYAPGAGERVPYLTVSRGTSGFRVAIHGYAEFCVAVDGRAIQIRPFLAVAASVIEQLLADVVLPRAMQLFGRPCLHASAVELPSVGVVAFVGDSGRGKSTLCAALSRHGRMLCDDCLAVNIDDGEVRVMPSYASLRLWPDSAEIIAGSDASSLPFATPRVGKLRLARDLPDEALPLRHILLLEVDPTQASPVLEPVSGVAAVAALARSVLRMDPTDAQLLEREFLLLTRLAEAVAIHRLRFAHAFEQLDTLVDRVRAMGA